MRKWRGNLIYNCGNFQHKIFENQEYFKLEIKKKQ